MHKSLLRVALIALVFVVSTGAQPDVVPTAAPVALSGDDPVTIARENIEWLDVWLPDTNKRDLPRVLLLGDSITRAYYPTVEAKLKGKAYVGRLATSKSLGDPAYLQEVALILQEDHFDIIHFNNGMHGDGYSEEQYAAAIPELLKTLRQYAPKAKLIWASTTAVRDKTDVTKLAPKTERIRARNKAFMDVVVKEQIPIDDLFGLCVDHPEWSSPKDGVHFVAAGSEKQGQQVADAVVKLLGK